MKRHASLARGNRRGNALVLTVIAILVVALVALIGWWFVGRDSGGGAPEVLVNTVSRGPYDFVVLEQGEVESANNTELKCEVKSRGAGGGGGSGGSITILEVIPEGTMVQAGDIVCRLDSSALEQEKITQQIKVNSQKSLLVQAENTLTAAKIARTEYLEGTFRQEEKLILQEVNTAEQSLRSAQLAFESSQRLAAKALIGALQIEGSQLQVDNAQNAVDIAKSKLDVLRKYTKNKMLTQFDSDIASAEAKVAAEKSSLALEEDKLREIATQIEKCTIRAPNPGQVVYANEYDSWRGSSQAEFVVAAGATVREHQAIIRLPNSNDMQVRASVNEARVTLVRPGLPVTVRVDALKDAVIRGEVTKVNQYADPGGFSSGNIKKYSTYIKILNPPPGLRSGMNAEVRIHLERQKDALQVPVQALAEHRGRFFSLVKNGTKFETREVEITSTNDKVAVIGKGLAEGDQVVLNPRGVGSLFDLPDLPEKNEVQIADIPKSGNTPITPAALAAAKAAAATPSLPDAAGGPPGGDGQRGPGGEGGRGEGGRGQGGRGEGKGKRGGGNFTPAMLVDRAFESDADKDGKISTAEMEGMDERRKQMLAGADANADGFIDRDEMTTAATAAMARMRQGGGPGGPGGGGPPGGGPGGGPAGGGQ